MRGKTRAHKPELELGLDKVTCRKRLTIISEIVEEIEVRLESCLNVEPIVSLLLGTLERDAQLDEEAIPSKLNSETSSETDTVEKELLIEVDRRKGVNIHVTMTQDGEGGCPPPMPPIDPLLKPRGLPIMVPQNLTAVDIPSHLPKFNGIKDEDPSRHMKRYIERLASSVVTNPEYWLVWFPTTLEL